MSIENPRSGDHDDRAPPSLREPSFPCISTASPVVARDFYWAPPLPISNICITCIYTRVCVYIYTYIHIYIYICNLINFHVWVNNSCGTYSQCCALILLFRWCSCGAWAIFSDAAVRESAAGGGWKQAPGASIRNARRAGTAPACTGEPLRVCVPHSGRSSPHATGAFGPTPLYPWALAATSVVPAGTPPSSALPRRLVGQLLLPLAVAMMVLTSLLITTARVFKLEDHDCLPHLELMNIIYHHPQDQSAGVAYVTGIVHRPGMARYPLNNMPSITARWDRIGGRMPL